MWYLYNEITGIGNSDVNLEYAVEALTHMLYFHESNNDKVIVTFDPTTKRITVSEPPIDRRTHTPDILN